MMEPQSVVASHFAQVGERFSLFRQFLSWQHLMRFFVCVCCVTLVLIKGLVWIQQSLANTQISNPL